MSSTLESEGNGGVDLTFEEMVERLGDQRRDLLSVLKRSDGSRLNTSDLRMGADVPSGSMSHHMETLQRWGLIEEVDRVHVGRGSRAIVWALTDAGEDFIAEDGLESGRKVARADDVQQLNQRVDELEDKVKNLKGIMMRIGVDSDTFTEDEAREIMGETRFREVFGG